MEVGKDTSGGDMEDTSGAVYSYSRRNLLIAAMGAAYLFTGVGLFMGWSSPAMISLPEAKGQNLTVSESTMIVSLPGLAPGPLITMFALDFIGRKWSLFLIWSTLMVFWAIINLSLEVTTIMVARFIGGWGMAASFSVVGIYISEISDVGVRSMLNTVPMIFLSMGIIVVQVVGAFITFSMLSLLGLLVTAGFALFFWFLAESPYYYLKRGDTEKAEATLLWLRHQANPAHVQSELRQIQYSIEEEKKTKAGLRKLFTSKAVLKQICIAWYLLFLQQASGLNAVLAYTQTIFVQAHSSIDAKYVPIFLGGLGFLAGLTSPIFMKKLGNKYCIPISTVGMGIGNVVTAVYFFLQESGSDTSSYSWLVIVSICFTNCICNVGMTGAVWSVVSDLFSPSVKGYATGISGIFSTLLGFVVNTVFGFSTDRFGFGVTFLGFGLIMLVSSVGLIFIPEFSKMTLQEIQDYFEGKDPKKDKEMS